MSCFCGLSQEHSKCKKLKINRKKPQELMNLTTSRNKAEEVAADLTVRSFILSGVLVVEMLSALLNCYP